LTRVETSRGALRGTAIAEGARFLGIPYAAPPVGERRYRAPVPAEPWAGERDATRFAPPAPQAHRAMPGLDSGPLLGPGWHGEEPQLALNVWTPGTDGPHPVMVDFHGGAFVAGAPSSPMLDGAAFARDGVVLVTVTYRLGIEGFLPLEGGEANVGLRDQLAALRWVQEEIAAFGGDPGNVTAFGQSAGAMSLGLLFPHLPGLVHRVISQSGGLTLTRGPEQAARVTEFVAGLLGVAPTREAFARVPIADVIAAQAQLVPGSVAFDDDPAGGLIVLLPVRDGDIVADDPLAAVRAVRDLPLLIGDTTEEGNLYVAGLPDPNPEAAAWITRTIFRDPTAAFARAHPGPTWIYEFAWRSQALGGRLGAAHAMDLPFVFDTLGAPGLRGENALLGPDGGPPELAARVHGAWVRFARDGDPGWPAGERHVFAS
jgi:para-nitrobenzyl esterase